MLYSKLAGGPTGTILEPNSTPMVTSWWETKRPSQSLMVSYVYQHRAEVWVAGVSYAGFAGAAIAQGDDLRDVVPWLLGSHEAGGALM